MPAAPEVLGHLVERGAQGAGPARAVPIDRVEHAFQMLCRRRDEVDDVLVERYDAHAIALAVREVGQARRRGTGRNPAWSARGCAKLIDREMSSSTEKLAFESASYCLT